MFTHESESVCPIILLRHRCRKWRNSWSSRHWQSCTQ